MSHELDRFALGEPIEVRGYPMKVTADKDAVVLVHEGAAGKNMDIYCTYMHPEIDFLGGGNRMVGIQRVARDFIDGRYIRRGEWRPYDKVLKRYVPHPKVK